MKVYIVECSDLADHRVHSIWSSKDNAEAEISRLRKLQTLGRLTYPRDRYYIYVFEHDVDPIPSEVVPLTGS